MGWSFRVIILKKNRILWYKVYQLSTVGLEKIETQKNKGIGMSNLNGTMMQYFHWYYPSDGSLWNKVRNEARNLADAGVTALWLPPAYKGTGGQWDVGYGVYDMYDLGEFDQKGSVRTKYGTKEEYLAAVDAAHVTGIQIYADMVFNHRGGADQTEWMKAVRVHQNDRNRFVTGEEEWIEVYTEFNFPGRNKTYSDFEWHYNHFTGVDWAANLNDNSIFKFLGLGKDWAQMVDGENGNYDYLMYSDIDFDNPEVRTELARWGQWFLETSNADGFRLDAIKHIKFSFFRVWLAHMRKISGRDLFAVGEYWNPYNVEDLHRYISATHGCMSLFDAPLHRNFYDASRSGGHYDMRCILDNTLMQQQPNLAVTLVENHDTQPLQALESTVDWWFKPIAYAIILLRREGYPCVFYADYYGAEYSDKGHDIYLAPVPKLHELMQARQRYAYGAQHDFFDHPNVIGWTREGVDELNHSGLAALVSDGSGGSKWMYVGERNANTVYHDLLGNEPGEVHVNEYGWGEFRVGGGSVSVWVRG